MLLPFLDRLTAAKVHYTQSPNAYLSGIPPQTALSALSVTDVLSLLAQKYSPTDLQQALQLDGAPFLPLPQEKNGDWLKNSNMVGVNVRTLGSFWKLVPYAMTLNQSQNAIHLLPFWEPGVVSSLYGMASWEINSAFHSAELEAILPQFNTAAKQLKGVVRLLHLMGKTVGLDVIPHTDRYSEIVLANPSYFEWLQRFGITIVSHDNDLHLQAQDVIWNTLLGLGSASPGLALPPQSATFWSLPEAQKLLLLFGAPTDVFARNARRDYFVTALFHEGYETVPATMAPPYRGIAPVATPEAITIDEKGRAWREYEITAPTPFSRVFGPLTRYKLFATQPDWSLDFDSPHRPAWAYVCDHYKRMVLHFGFDFMRGDMSHVQMRPSGVPQQDVDGCYDLLKAVKKAVQADQPSFAYFAESFLAPPNAMAFGDEGAHLDLSEAEVALGDLQNAAVHAPEWLAMLENYQSLKEKHHFAPSFTLFTSDKDDPRFDACYQKGNALRQFMAFFLIDWPSYSALGFEQRDAHYSAAPNEFYTKLYVFKYQTGPKATQGPYLWGANLPLFDQLDAIKRLADSLLPLLQNTKTDWVLGPTVGQKVLVWTQLAAPTHLFVANTATNTAIENLSFSLPTSIASHLLAPEFSFSKLFSTESASNVSISTSTNGFCIPLLLAGECCVFEIQVILKE